MMKTIMAAALCAVLAATPALAQSQSGDNGSATTTSPGAVSGTAQAANNVTVVADAGRYAPANTSVRETGHVYGTPVVAGSYFAGANPCLVGTGGGASGGPVGFSINVGRNDEGCTRRSDAAAWHALGLDQVAIARMCADRANADAFFSATGLACPGTGGDRYRLPSGEKAPVAALPRPAFAQSRALPPELAPQPGR